MPLQSAFAPYRLAPDALPDAGTHGARLVGAGPMVVAPDLPLRPALLGEALASVEVGRAASEAEACRSSDGSLAGNPETPRACLVGEPHRQRVGEEARAALAAGYAGVVFEAPDAPLVEGLLGAGFCPDCQREFQRQLVRKYGDQFQPLDFLATVRAALAGAPGALSLADLPFGRDFWRLRHESLERAVRAHVRVARDAGREAGRSFLLCGWFGGLGPSQLAAARHLDAAVFPIALRGYPLAGRFELLRGALRRRALAVEPPPGTPPASWLRLASMGAPFGVGLAGVQPGGEAGALLSGIRVLMSEVAARGGAPALATPVSEISVLYSAEADFLGGGSHRHAVETAIEALAYRQLQVTLTVRPSEVPLGTPLVLADAKDLSRLESREVEKRRAAGGTLLSFAGPGDEAPFERSVDALFPADRRAVTLTASVPVIAAVRAHGEAVDVHLATTWPDRASRVRLRIPVVATRGARKAHFRTSDGGETRVRFSSAGDWVVTELPSFTGYAVLTPET
jgi:hypothetical protein